MKRIFLFYLIGLIFWSCDAANPEIQKDKEVILVRKIGHEITKYIGDSTSSISPITQLAPRTYQLDFKVPFSFVSDTIINIIDQEIKKVTNDEYVVKVNSCSLNELIFSYFISPVEDENLVSCLGRNQREDCYNIQLTFLDNKKVSKGPLILIVIISIVLFFFLFTKQWRRRESSNEKQSDSDFSNGSTEGIGQFVFHFEEQYLEFNDNKESLTYKEAKILSILNKNFNEVVTRESLLKEVWEDEGLMVSRSLDMFISKLRKKLKADSSVQIINIHGIGYKLISG